MSKPRIAVQLYSVRHELTKDLPGTLKAVREMGYEGVEFYGGYIRPDIIKKALEDTGLKVIGWHTQIANIMPGLIEAAILYNKQIGNNSMVVPALPSQYTETKAGWLQAAEILQVAAKRLAEEGMYTGYHNHHTEFSPVEGETPWDIIANATDKGVALQMDTGNCMRGAGDPLGLMGKDPGRSRLVHLKPYSKADEFATMIGRDDTDWQALKSICEGEGKTEWYIVEYECETIYKPLEGIQLCIKALKELGF
jgi:sugar phosphate isomerase/epimerase